MQMSAISFVACEKEEKRNLSACNKLEIGDVNPGYLRWPWWVKFSRIKDNIPIIYISSFRHFLVKNKPFY